MTIEDLMAFIEGAAQEIESRSTLAGLFVSSRARGYAVRRVIRAGRHPTV
jgi:hypothetical protein